MQNPLVSVQTTLSWTKHIGTISKRISSGIEALKRLMPSINCDTAMTMYHALIDPHFQYCITVWDGLAGRKTPKNCINRASRIITGLITIPVRLSFLISLVDKGCRIDEPDNKHLWFLNRFTILHLTI